MQTSTRFLALTLVAISTSLCASAETRTFDAVSFTALDISSGVDVSFRTGEAFSVTAEHNHNNWDKLEIEVRGDTLHIRRKSKLVGWGDSRKLKFQVTVTAPELNKVKSSSGSDVSGSGLSGDLVRLKSSSGSDLNVTDIQATRVKADASSGSDLNISGTCIELNAISSSGSDVDARDLICRDVFADASSGSDIVAHATELVHADASSGADININGGATDVQADKSSGGGVRVR